MMLDKKMIDQLLTLPDDQLLQMVQLLGGGKLGGKSMGMPNAETMRRVRAVLAEITEGDLDRLAALLAVYQNTQ